MRRPAPLALIPLLLLAALPLGRMAPFPPRPRQSGAMRAMEFFAKARAWPDPVMPDRGHAEAFEAARALPADPATGGRPGSSTAARQPAVQAGGGPAAQILSEPLVPPWRPLGPTNIGGRTLAIAINPLRPSTVWAGSAGGGLWRSWTGGVGAAAWHRVTTGFPVLAASAIAIDPADTNVVYLGTGEVYASQNSDGGLISRYTRGSYGIGILKSIDGGATWQLSLDWRRDQKQGIWAIRIDPRHRNRIWAATTNGVYRSLDSGGTWARVLTTLMAMDLELHPTRPDTVYAACGNFGSTGLGIYRTMNGGTNWTKLGGGLPASWLGQARLAVSPQAPDVVYVSFGGTTSLGGGSYILRSFNDGTTWTLTSGGVDYAVYQGWYSQDIAVDPTAFDRVFAVGIDIWRSLNSGAGLTKVSDWTLYDTGAVPPGGPEGAPTYSHADHHAAVFHPTNTQILYFATDGGIFRTVNGGATFEGLNGGYQTAQFYPGFGCATDDTVPAIGGMQDNFSAIYEGGPAWNRVLGGDGCYAAVEPGAPQTLYGSLQGLTLFRSIDAGLNFDEITPGSGGTTAFVAPFAISPADPAVIYAGRSLVLRSANRGTTWSPGLPPSGRPIVALAAAAGGVNRILVGTEPDAGGGHSVFRSDDGGFSWTDISAGLPNRYPLDLVIAPDNPSVFYATFGGFGTSHLYRSVNSGSTWQDIGWRLPDVPTWALAVDPLDTQRLFAGNDLGVFVSPDGGQTWGSFSEGLPEAVIVSDLVIVPGPRRLRVATHGHGVFERPLPGGLTAVGETPAPRPSTAMLAAAPNPFRDQVRLTLPGPARVGDRLTLTDVAGRVVRQITVGGAGLAPGARMWDWDGRDRAGAPVAPGVYFVRYDSEGRGSGATVRVVRRR